MRKLTLLLGLMSSALIAPVMTPAMAQEAPPSQEQEAPQQADDKGQHKPQNDKELIATLMAKNTPDSKNLADLIHFVDAEGSVTGALQSCNVKMADMFRKCSFEILGHWKQVSGLDMPDMHTPDKSSSEVVQYMWGLIESDAAQMSAQHPGDCQGIITRSQSSSIWQYCNHPDWSIIDTESPDTGQGSNTTPQDETSYMETIQ